LGGAGWRGVVSGQKGERGGTQNVGGDGVVLPVGVGMGGKRYVAWRWVGWPLGKVAEVPMGRVVGKVAEAAGRGVDCG
jgi:hypothetical protein